MALRGGGSRSFLRTKDLISFSEIAYDRDGNYIFEKGVLQDALQKDEDGNFIRSKKNIAEILDRYGVIYRMVFNAMNMEQYTYEEVKDAIEYLSSYINDLGVSGIVEFHASDKTQNSDHIHFWINREDRLIYNKIAEEMVLMGYSNIEDIYIQKYEENRLLDEKEYVNSKDTPLDDRFLPKPMGEERGEVLHSINDMLSIDGGSSIEIKERYKNISYLQERYYLLLDRIDKMLEI